LVTAVAVPAQAAQPPPGIKPEQLHHDQTNSGAGSREPERPPIVIPVSERVLDENGKIFQVGVGVHFLNRRHETVGSLLRLDRSAAT
jgi:hypothetical protein